MSLRRRCQALQGHKWRTRMRVIALALGLVLALPIVAADDGQNYVAGQVTARDDDSLTIRLNDKSITMSLTSSTKWFNQKNSPIRSNDVRKDSTVIVAYGEGRKAQTVHVAGTQRGKITKVNSGSLNFTDSDGKAQELRMPANSLVTDQSNAPARLAANLNATFYIYSQGDNTVCPVVIVAKE
jgi:hypothetical protein